MGHVRSDRAMKILFTIIALLYVLNPYDLVPDFLVGWGWLDDLLAGLFVWWLYKSLQRRRGQRPLGSRGDGSRGGRNKASAGERNGARAQNTGARPDDPYTVLGIDRDAPEADIKKAYRQLASQYHPDKVSHLGPEFRELAEQRFKEIQQAYEHIMAARGR